MPTVGIRACSPTNEKTKAAVKKAVKTSNVTSENTLDEKTLEWVFFLDQC
jgi:hypothetical protein